MMPEVMRKEKVFSIAGGKFGKGLTEVRTCRRCCEMRASVNIAAAGLQ